MTRYRVIRTQVEEFYVEADSAGEASFLASVTNNKVRLIKSSLTSSAVPDDTDV